MGPSLKKIHNSYVCIDNILYSTSSTVEAIDVCLKAFHVLQLNYPAASEHLWLLIQKCIYKFRTKWDYVIPHTEHIIQNFEKKIDSTSQDIQSSDS